VSGQDWPTRSADLLAALGEVDGLSAVASPLLPIRPPAAVLLPPTFTWGSFADEPDAFEALVAIVERGGDGDQRALEELLRWVPLVATAIENAPDAVVTRAAPGSFLSSGSGTTPLPCYYLEVAL
jgi:hypothetical protein